MASLLERLPVELIQNDLALQLDPRSLHTLGWVSKSLYRATRLPSSRIMWNQCIEIYGIPECPEGQIEPYWILTLHVAVCSGCGVEVRRYMDPSLLVRLCGSCCVIESIIDRAEIQEHEVRDNLVFSNKVGSIAQKRSGRWYCLRSDYEEGIVQWDALQSGGANAQTDWDSWKEKKQERLLNAVLIQDYIQLDREAQRAIWNSDIDARLGEVGLSRDPNVYLLPKHQGKWQSAVTWPLRALNDELFNQIKNKLRDLLSQNRRDMQRLELQERRETALKQILHPMEQEGEELANSLSSNLTIRAFTSLAVWKPVPLFSDIICLPAVAGWLKAARIPDDADEDSMSTASIPSVKVVQAINNMRTQTRHEFAEMVREARRRDGAWWKPQAQLSEGLLDNAESADALRNLDPDISLLIRADNLFYIGEQPGLDVVCLDAIILELRHQDQQAPVPRKLSDYKYHPEASRLARRITSELANRDISCVEFNTKVFKCCRCNTHNLYGFDVIIHYLEASRLNMRILKRREALQSNNQTYKYLHGINHNYPSPVVVEAPIKEVQTNEGFKYRSLCLICSNAGVEDPSFANRAASACWNMCVVHLMEEHEIELLDVGPWMEVYEEEEEEEDSDMSLD